ncbi:MAG: hypothetical protein M1434_10030 [Chloroflexi bacterium]|nr:hypothetical protein [Chloroflexota bacterium]
MSINSLTNDEIRRHAAFKPSPVTKGLDLASPQDAATYRALNEASIQDNQVTITLNALVKYIPTEIVTLYVAAASATPSLRVAIPVVDGRLVYWGFAAMTPILLILMYASKRASDGIPPLPKAKELPWWKMSAATVAFLVWALAVPGNPYVLGDSGAVIAGFGAIIISTLLTLLEPIFERPSAISPQPSPVPTVPQPVPQPTTPQPAPQTSPQPTTPPTVPPTGAG